MYLPDGFGTIAPYIFVRGAGEFGKFLKKAFSGVETIRTKHPDGAIANLQIKIGSTAIMISEESDGYPAMSSAFYIFVENADDAMEQAIAAGAILEMGVADMPYNDRQGGVKDPFGNIWWISQHLVDRPYD